MHTIHIRNVNDDIYRKLLESCEYSQRSVSKEALVLLRDALDTNANDMLKRRRILHDLDAFRTKLQLDKI